MSIKKKYFQSTTKALAFLDELANDRRETFIFRGHSNMEHRLENTEPARSFPGGVVSSLL